MRLLESSITYLETKTYPPFLKVNISLKEALRSHAFDFDAKKKKYGKQNSGV